MIITKTQGKSKAVMFWLINEEKNNPVLRESLKPLFRESKAQGYLPVVMQSGEGDLKESMKSLMKHEGRRMARAELTAEKTECLSSESLAMRTT